MRKPFLEVIFEPLIEHFNSDLKEVMRAAHRPAHLLFLG